MAPMQGTRQTEAMPNTVWEDRESREYTVHYSTLKILVPKPRCSPGTFWGSGWHGPVAKSSLSNLGRQLGAGGRERGGKEGFPRETFHLPSPYRRTRRGETEGCGGTFTSILTHWREGGGGSVLALFFCPYIPGSEWRQGRRGPLIEWSPFS